MQEPIKRSTDRVAALGEALVLRSAAVADAELHLAGAQAELHLAGAQAELHLAGAEANVAAGLVAWGVPASFVGRLGDDAFGALIRSELAGRGVDISAVETDPIRPTGHYYKITAPDEAGELRTESRYSRAGSAASAMDPGFLDSAAVASVFGHAAVVHCSGITAALSDTCLALMHRLVTDRPGITGLVSFDVNWREQLWPDGDPAEVIALADRADLVLVGGDEAIRVMGTDDPAALRRILPNPATLVIKDGAHRAIAVDRAGATIDVPALSVDVVEPVGAGDAFAAGFLTGVVRGEDMAACLRRGHLGAAVTLTVVADSAPPPPDETVHHLLTCSAREWAATSVTADGISVQGVSL
ncbi:sugar kinase [Mycolicibacterium mageritense]|uniref:2-dehydro-3-deoxygluconokinase n=1 Tax=Mycolicibacterium mageritense TaxID=53462 RepID=A0AAI8U1S7_MYCME|nr:sugar kinase [Mycolicibacterium mageritense]BDY32406.1 2-dehydro-3-deoxygluconokinase [Mycolicibacterium mageritense]